MKLLPNLYLYGVNKYIRSQLKEKCEFWETRSNFGCQI